MCDFPPGATTKHGKCSTYKAEEFLLSGLTTAKLRTKYTFHYIQLIFYSFVSGLSIKVCLIKKKIITEAVCSFSIFG